MPNMSYIVRFLSLVAFLGLSHYLYLNGHMILRHMNLDREIIEMTHHALYSLPRFDQILLLQSQIQTSPHANYSCIDGN